jgi:hypothetical protein
MTYQLHPLRGGFLELELGSGVLTEVGESVLGVVRDLTGGGGEFVGEQFEPSGLAGTVGTHHTTAGGGGHIVVDRIIENEVAGLHVVTEAHVFAVDQRNVLRSQLLRVVQGSSHRESELNVATTTAPSHHKAQVRGRLNRTARDKEKGKGQEVGGKGKGKALTLPCRATMCAW